MRSNVRDRQGDHRQAAVRQTGHQLLTRLLLLVICRETANSHVDRLYHMREGCRGWFEGL